jgi:Ca2+-binding RTX toxin-like protein
MRVVIYEEEVLLEDLSGVIAPFSSSNGLDGFSVSIASGDIIFRNLTTDFEIELGGPGPEPLIYSRNSGITGTVTSITIRYGDILAAQFTNVGWDINAMLRHLDDWNYNEFNAALFGFPTRLSFPNADLLWSQTSFAQAVGALYFRGTTVPDIIYGSRLSDSLSGAEGDDELYGGSAGADRIWGQSGNDQLDTEAGNDRLNGGSGNDHLSGGFDHDRLIGGSGDDYLDGQSGRDRLYGGKGNDILNGDQEHWPQTFPTGPDDTDDRLYGGAGRDTLRSGAGNDEVYGGKGRDILSDYDFFSRRDFTGEDTLTGGPGRDVFVISDSERSVTITDFNPKFDRLNFESTSYRMATDYIFWVVTGRQTPAGLTFSVGDTTVLLEDVSLGDLRKRVVFDGKAEWFYYGTNIYSGISRDSDTNTGAQDDFAF